MKRWMTKVAMPAVLLLLISCGDSPDPAPKPGATAGRGSIQVSGSWPRWGGPDGSFKVPDEGLAESWPADGPTELWRRPLGPGYSAVVVEDGTAYTMYRDGDSDVAVALRAGDGEIIWERRVDAPTREANQTQFGSGPNATPLVAAGRIVTLGYTGKLESLDAATGEALWSHDLIRDFDGEVLSFGYSASPVMHDGKLIVLVGGDTQAVLALDPDDGAVVWRSPPGSVSYATPLAIDVDGHAELVYFSADEVVGLDPATGERRWSHPCVNQYRNNATDAIWGGDNLLWVATQLDGGTRVLRLSRSGGATDVEEVWFNDRVKIHFWNALRLGDHVYASIGTQAAMFVAAVDVKTGEILWRERGFDQMSLVQAGDRTVFLDGEGHLGLATLGPDGMTIHSQVRIVEDVTWTPPTLAGTTLFVRDKKTVRAFDLSG